MLNSERQQQMFIAADSVQQIPVSQLFSVLWRRKLLISSVILIFNVPVLLYISQLTPYYSSTASVLVETAKTAFNDLQAAMSNITTDTVSLRTQADIIQSPTLALKVARKLDLAHDPEFSREIDAPPSLMTKAKDWVQSRFHPVTPPQALTDEERNQLVAGMLARRLTVGNVGRSYVIDMSVRTGSPELSAKIANAYADFYVVFNQETKQATMARGAALLDKQIEPLRNRVRDAELAVEKFREENGLLLSQMSGGKGAQDGTTIPSQQLAQITAQLSDAVANLAQKEASLSSVAGAQQRGGGAAYGITEVIASPLIQRLREQEAQIMTRVASTNAVPGNDNPLLRSTNLELAAVRRQINQEVGKIVDSLRSEAAAARARRDSLKASLAALQTTVTEQNQAGITLKQLESQAEASRKVYRDFLSRYEQTSSQRLLQEPEASVVATALPPLFRSGPPKGLYGAVSVLFSSMMAVMAAFLVDRSRGHFIRTAEQLRSGTGLDVLGTIPNLRGQPINSRRLSGARESLSFIQSFLRQKLKDVPRIIMITSALPSEGKTWFASLYAANAGQNGERVLLIDCNQHRPGVSTVLGLRDVARAANDSNPFVLRRNVLTGVDVITFGPGDGSAIRDGIHGLLKAATAHYGLILLDTPPVLASADAAFLAAEADGVIMIVRWGTTSALKVQSAIQQLSSVKAQFLGAILTQTNLKDQDDLAARYGSALQSPRLSAGS